MNKKYELTSETFMLIDVILHRIRALRSFSDVKEGDLGGYIRSERNLSHKGTCWVYDNAYIAGNAKVHGNAHISKDCLMIDGTQIYDNAHVSGGILMYDSARIYGNAHVSGNVRIGECAQVYGNAHVSGDVKLDGKTQIYGDTRVDLSGWNKINKDIKIDHGIWKRFIQIGDNFYLVSSTLEKLLM